MRPWRHHSHVCSAVKSLCAACQSGFGEIVAATAFRQEGDAGPCQEDAYDLCAEIGGHPQQVPQVHQLGFAVFGNGAAEVIVSGHGVDLDALIGGRLAELAAAGLRHVERVSVGALAVDLHALISEFARASDDLLDGQRATAVPDAAVGDAVQPDFDIRFGCGVRRTERACERRGLNEAAPAEMGVRFHKNLLPDSLYEAYNRGNHPIMNRREFLVAPAAVLAGNLIAADSEIPWQRRIRRLGQTNMTEHDPAVLDVEQWADYWASLKIDAVMVSVTGILAFYQTKVPYHRKGKYLGSRDFFGECCAAAKKRGIRVIARMSPDLNWEDAVQAHPEWFQRNAQGEAVHHSEDARLFRTCMFTTYMTDYMPAIMREINSLYDVDGMFTNAWPPLGSMPVCHCDQCRKLPPSGTPAYWDKFNERTVYLWKLYDSIAKEKKPGNFYFANLGGGIRSTANLVQLGEICEWFQCDNQGRGGDDTPIWGCALQGRVCSAVQKGKMATNVTAAWSTGVPRWRNVYKSQQEEQMWFDETLASGMVPYHHFIGGENGMGADRRWLEPARKYFEWMSKHDAHFVNRRTIANIGVVMGQRTHLFYKPPRGTVMKEYMDGLVLRAAGGAIPFRLRTRGAARGGGPGEVLGAAAAEHGAAQRPAVPAIGGVRERGRITAGDVRDEHVQRAE